MTNGRIAFVVGHANWGKSSTLRSLTGGEYRQRRIEVRGTEFQIRRMSNDDRPDSFVAWINSIDPAAVPNAIATLCPNFQNEAVPLDPLLENIRQRGYRLHFWVIEHQFGTSRTVSNQEITSLRKFGIVEVFSKIVESEIRAIRLKTFIERIVLA